MLQTGAAGSSPARLPEQGKSGHWAEGVSYASRQMFEFLSLAKPPGFWTKSTGRVSPEIRGVLFFKIRHSVCFLLPYEDRHVAEVAVVSSAHEEGIGFQNYEHNLSSFVMRLAHLHAAIHPNMRMGNAEDAPIGHAPFQGVLSKLLRSIPRSLCLSLIVYQGNEKPHLLPPFTDKRPG